MSKDIKVNDEIAIGGFIVIENDGSALPILARSAGGTEVWLHPDQIVEHKPVKPHRFEARGINVYVNPRATEDGQMTLGFNLLRVNDLVDDPAIIAETITKMLNNHWKD